MEITSSLQVNPLEDDCKLVMGEQSLSLIQDLDFLAEWDNNDTVRISSEMRGKN
ncbi:hypothetical protein [Negadavirga shengliensis]|uniref:Uncharacterized protein n=1 Tax=Negadavirga shengliensis TaxID=1389218 RepID=A0ABV9T2E3_9BACT